MSRQIQHLQATLHDAAEELYSINSSLGRGSTEDHLKDNTRRVRRLALLLIAAADDTERLDRLVRDRVHKASRV